MPTQYLFTYLSSLFVDNIKIICMKYVQDLWCKEPVDKCNRRVAGELH